MRLNAAAVPWLRWRAPACDGDETAGVVEAAAGATIADLITFGEAFGWFPPVTPGPDSSRRRYRR